MSRTTRMLAALVVAHLVVVHPLVAEPIGAHGSLVERERAEPDVTSRLVGGAAARIHDADGTPVPGNLFLLMGAPGSTTRARVYDETAYEPGMSRFHPDTYASNVDARATVEMITGVRPGRRVFTAAPAGGPSGGLTYVIAYLNGLTDGAFTGELVVAATGLLIEQGYVRPVRAVDEKSVAADLADVDVMFTSVMPSEEVIEAIGGRAVGALARARNTDRALTDERMWSSYLNWGATRPAAGMDIVGVQHVGDCAAYLCGAGTDEACAVLDRLRASGFGVPGGNSLDAPVPGRSPSGVPGPVA